MAQLCEHRTSDNAQPLSNRPFHSCSKAIISEDLDGAHRVVTEAFPKVDGESGTGCIDRWEIAVEITPVELANKITDRRWGAHNQTFFLGRKLNPDAPRVTMTFSTQRMSGDGVRAGE